MRKVFILTQFGDPHAWTQQYIDNVQKLWPYGWEWKIFTSNDIKSKGNVEVIPMTIDEFNRLVEKTCNINPEVAIKDGLPTKPMSDYYVASGLIFQNYIKNFDFWGITNWDVIYGRLDHFIKERDLEKCDIWSDDVGAINGVFSLYRNNEEINNLFKKIPYWQAYFLSKNIVGTDEYKMTEIAPTVRFEHPHFYPLHSHDRLENHVPRPKLQLEKDGSLWELLADTNPPNWIHRRPFIGREIPYFHFSKTKRWPL
jgi:hypothetical protein